MSNSNVAIPADLRQLMRMFAVLRTIRTHIDPNTNEGVSPGDKQLAEEVNEWIKTNPVFTKQDIDCLKVTLQRHNIPKSFWQGLFQDMRGKTYYDLFQCLARDYERWGGSFQPARRN
ncbi:MAG: hypothetical protein ACXV7C_11135 [Candidatus Angelobacter sp.]